MYWEDLPNRRRNTPPQTDILNQPSDMWGWMSYFVRFKKQALRDDWMLHGCD
jgi:hypothetical protein